MSLWYVSEPYFGGGASVLWSDTWNSNQYTAFSQSSILICILFFSYFATQQQEFEVCPSGKLRYANNSNYKDDSIIRREVCLGPAVVTELKRIIRISKITTVDDEKWGEPPDARHWELEIKIGNEHICFNCAEITSLADIQYSPDPSGLTVVYYLIQDLKCFILSLINLHFKVKPFWKQRRVSTGCKEKPKVRCSASFTWLHERNWQKCEHNCYNLIFNRKKGYQQISLFIVS